MKIVFILSSIFITSCGLWAQLAETLPTQPSGQPNYDERDPWDVDEVNRQKDRVYSQFRNVFVLMIAGIDLHGSANNQLLQGAGQLPAYETGTQISPGIVAGLGALVEIKNQVVKENYLGPEKKWMRLGSLTNIQYVHEIRPGAYQAANGNPTKMVMTLEKFEWEQIFYYYQPAHEWIKSNFLGLNRTTLLFGLGFNLSNTFDSRTFDYGVNGSFIASREFDFSALIGNGIYWTFQENMMLLFFQRFGINTTPSVSHPISGNTIDQQEFFSYRFTAAFGIRL